MRLVRFAVDHPVFTVMIYLGMLVLGLMSFYYLPIDLMPEMEMPAVSVITTYSGASAVDVESAVTSTVENVLATVNNLDELSSSSKEGVSLVTCRFKWGTDLAEASNDIRDSLERAKRLLPDDIEDPVIFKFNTSMIPLLGVSVTARQNYDGMERLLENRVTDVLKRIPGVGTVAVMGLRQRQINVELDQRRCEAYGLTPALIAAAIAAENRNVPTGFLKFGQSDYMLRVPGEFAAVAELAETVVGVRAGQPVRLRDVAKVTDGFVERGMYMESDRNPYTAFFMVQKQSGANTVAIARAVRARLDEIAPTLPADMQVKTVFDTSDFILMAVDQLYGSVLMGGIFVVLVVMLFLRRVRSSIIIALAIPSSLIIAFVFLFAFDYTINLMSLASLAIAIGMVVDNSVVVLDNISKQLERGVRPREAAIYGTGEVAGAVTASTLTTIITFVPILFVTGITGIIFKQLGGCIIVTICVSLLVSLTLTPMLCARWLTTGTTASRRLTALFAASERWFARLEDLYRDLLDWALGHRTTVAGAALGLLVFSFALIPLCGTEFTPEEDAGEIRVTYELPVGTRYEETARVGRQIVGLVGGLVPEQRMVFLMAGSDRNSGRAGSGMASGTNIGTVIMRVGSKVTRERSTRQIGDALRPHLLNVPGVRRISLMTGNPMSTMLTGGGKPLQYEIRGKDLDLALRYAQQVQEIFRRTAGADDVQLSLDLGQPELRLTVDRDAAARLGLSTTLIADTVRDYFDGTVASRYREAGEEYDIRVRLADARRTGPRDLTGITLRSMTGAAVPLTAVARLTEERGPVAIDRINQERVIKISANVGSRSLGEIAADIDAGLAGIAFPPELATKWGGMVKEQQSSFRDIFLLLALGIVLVYMVMAAQFESLRDPFIIMFSVPFALTGVILAIFLTGNTISLISFIGLIMLVGVVVNNAIVLVDYTNLLRARGADVCTAIREAGRNRLRPVLVTTITTLLGLFPMALTRGDGSETWSPLGWSLIGGLSLSTLVTLVLVPVIYSYFEERRGRALACTRESAS